MENDIDFARITMKVPVPTLLEEAEVVDTLRAQKAAGRAIATVVCSAYEVHSVMEKYLAIREAIQKLLALPGASLSADGNTIAIPCVYYWYAMYWEDIRNYNRSHTLTLGAKNDLDRRMHVTRALLLARFRINHNDPIAEADADAVMEYVKLLMNHGVACSEWEVHTFIPKRPRPFQQFYVVDPDSDCGCVFPVLAMSELLREYDVGSVSKRLSSHTTDLQMLVCTYLRNNLSAPVPFDPSHTWESLIRPGVPAVWSVDDWLISVKRHKSHWQHVAAVAAYAAFRNVNITFWQLAMHPPPEHSRRPAVIVYKANEYRCPGATATVDLLVIARAATERLYSGFGEPKMGDVEDTVLVRARRVATAETPDAATPARFLLLTHKKPELLGEELGDYLCQMKTPPGFIEQSDFPGAAFCVFDPY